MPYGTIKVDTVTFTNAGVDKSVTLSGLVQNPVFSGNVTVTGTLSGVTVTGTTANFTSGNFTNISGGTHTITSGVFAAGSAASPSITFTGDLNTGIYSPGADQVAISTGGSGRLFVDASGRVGVGTASPGENLSIGGGANLYVTLTSTGGIKTALAAADANGFGWAGSTTNHAFTLFTNNAERLRITSAGLVGVGTSAPNSNLHVKGGVTGTNIQIEGSASTDYTFAQAINPSGVQTQLAANGNASARLITASNHPLEIFTNNTRAILVDTSQRVGIGTTSPQTPLHVSTANSEQGRFESTGASYINVKGSAGQNLLGVEPGAGWVGPIESIALAFKTGNSERARIDSSGRLGVGTSSPYSRLTVLPAVTPSTPATANQITVGEQTGNSAYRLQVGYLFDTLGRGSIQSYDNNNPSPLILNGAGGNVGIGTTSPGGKLQINTQDGFLFDVGAGAYAYMRFGSQGAGEGVAELANERTTGKVFLKTGLTGSTLNTRLEINGAGATIINNQSGTERARIDSSGRLLVGTSSARSTYLGAAISAGINVEAAGNLGASNRSISVVNGFASSTDGDPIIYLGRTRSDTVGGTTIVQNADNIGRLEFVGSDGTNMLSCARIMAFVDGTPGANDMPGRLVFSTTADGASSPTERMRITQDGSVLLNTGGNTIEVTTGTTTGAYYNNSGKQLVLARDGGAPLVVQRRSSDGTIQGFYRDGTLVGTISVTTTATAYNTSSDYRLKENVTAVTDGITRLQQLKPSRFNFIADPTKTVDGFLAHEVQTIVPEAITGEKDAVDDEGNPQYQGIDQSKLVPLLTAALQEAIGEIESLKARVVALESA